MIIVKFRINTYLALRTVTSQMAFISALEAVLGWTFTLWTLALLLTLFAGLRTVTRKMTRLAAVEAILKQKSELNIL